MKFGEIKNQVTVQGMFASLFFLCVLLFLAALFFGEIWVVGSFGVVLGGVSTFSLTHFMRKFFDERNRITYLRLALRSVEVEISQLINIKSQYLLPKIETTKDFDPNNFSTLSELYEWIYQGDKDKLLTAIIDPEVKIYLERNECFKVLDHDSDEFRRSLDKMMCCYIWLEVNLSSYNEVKSVNKNLCLETKQCLMSLMPLINRQDPQKVHDISQKLLDIKTTNMALLNYINKAMVFSECLNMEIKRHLSEVSISDRKRFEKPSVAEEFKKFLTTDEEKKEILSGQLAWLRDK